MTIQVAKAHYFKEKYLSIHRFISYYYQVDAVRRAKSRSILFIGVGDGMVTGFLKKHPDYAVTTLDIDPELGPDLVGDIRRLSFDDNSFDLVCAFEVLEHLPFEESCKALAEMARVSSKSVLVSVPHRRSGFELVLRFPGIRSLLKREFLRLPLLFPIRFHGFAESGQHHWEIDGRTTTLDTVREAFEEHFVIASETTPVLDSYLRFFTLRKKDALKHGYVRDYYNETLQNLDEDYEHERWHSSPEREFDYRQTRRALVAALGGNRYRYTIEVGPGDGVWTRIVKSVTGKLHLVEQSTEMLSRAKRRLADIPDITYEEGDVLLAHPEPGADLLIAMRCFEYMSDKAAALMAFKNSLAPGGRLIIVTKNPEYRRLGAAPTRTLHTGQVSKSDMQSLLQSQGFIVEAAYPATFRWKSSWLPMRLLFGALHNVSTWLKRDVPILGRLASESYTYVARRP